MEYLFAPAPVVTYEENGTSGPMVWVTVNRGQNDLGYLLGATRPSAIGCRLGGFEPGHVDLMRRQDEIETGSQEVPGSEWGV